MKAPAYAELHCLSNFSFLRGASSAQQLFERAAKLGYRALAVTDEASMAGIVRALEASRKTGVALIVGSELQLEDGPKLVLLAENLAGYRTLCRWISLGRRRSPKGSYRLAMADLDGASDGLVALWCPQTQAAQQHGEWLQTRFPGRAWIAVELHRGSDDDARLRELLALGEDTGLPFVAAGDVHMHARGRRALQDTMTAIRHRTTLAEAGKLLHPNGERHLRRREVLAGMYPTALLAESVAIAARCRFSLEELDYQYPHEVTPEGMSASAWLRELTERGATWRWPRGVSDKVRGQIEHELALIAELGYEPYFLTVYDIVRFAREAGILCQGRGSAANSAVCYALGITEVNPARVEMLMERFISRERREPPDIDVDFDSSRREEVIQYVYARYGRERAALTAVVVTYSGRSAIRDVAAALGFAPDQVDRLARCVGRSDDEPPPVERLREAGFDPDNPVLHRALVLAAQIRDFPRHLSQHPGGFVISETPLADLVPVENAAMPERSVVQWDKDDLDTLGLLKIDVLGIGMLGAISRCLALLRRHHRGDWTPATIPVEDPKVYAMIQRADTVGTFQIESRAQMSMLPRLRPACYYDLVIEVAIVRPGPIEGKMVHPYLRRRQGKEPVTMPSPALATILGRTLGIPLFQEQVMQIAMTAAGYTPGEADQLRRSMAAWKRHGDIEQHRQKILSGMRQRGYEERFAEQVFEQIRGFGSYGFPESHAASYALVAYVSSWLKCHEPAAFACALINAPAPMGFYTPDQILQDVRRHGIAVRAIDIGASDWESTLEPDAQEPSGQPAIRLGLNRIRGFPQAAAERIMIARARRPFAQLDELACRAGLDRRCLRLLADANALEALAGHRHNARWAASGVDATLPLFAGTGTTPEEPITLPTPTVQEEMLDDYAATGTTLGPHPLQLLRGALRQERCATSRELASAAHGSTVRHAGLVTLRQRPPTAKGVTFVTLEDEDGTVNVVLWHSVTESQQRELANARLLEVEGRWEAVDGTRHLIANRLRDLSPLLGKLDVRSHDYH